MENTLKIFDYSQLATFKEALQLQFYEEGFIAVQHVPGFKAAYEDFIRETQKFIALEEAIKAKYTPDDFFIRGWSYGVETFNGHTDSYKGSYYAKFPDNDVENIWPEKEVPSFKKAYSLLAKIMFEIGKEILALMELETNELFATGRMLYYGPIAQDSETVNPNWCGLHRDHGLFTGLCPALYMKEGKRVSKPTGAGLYIRDKEIILPNQDILLFQIGELAELLTNGRITATDHLVKKAYGGYERYAFALFIDPPKELKIHSSVTKYNDRYRPGISYGEWSEASFKKYN